MTNAHPFRRPLELVTRYELIVTLSLAPLFLFPGRWTILGGVALALIWLIRWHTTGRLTRTSAMSMPQILLTLMAIIGYFISVDQALSAPKLWGILFQTALFFAVLNGLHDWKDAQWLAWGVLAMTAAVALASLVGTQWDVVRLVNLPLYDRLPQLIRDIPDSGLSPGQAYFHPREVGATMGMLLPFVSAVFLFGWSRRVRLAAVPVLLLGGFVLILSQAIMGLVGLLAGWAILAVWWRRWMLIPLSLGAVGLAAAAWRLAPPNWQAILFSLDSPIGLGVLLRLDIWSRALAMIADMPYTGIGLNTFPLIQTHFYIGYLLGPEPHAHNLWLQTAVDLGLPGLVALVWLMIAFYVTVWQAGRRLEERWLRALVAGTAAGVTAYLVGGTFDVMTLGAKPVAALSILLGYAGAIHWLAAEAGETPAQPAGTRRRQQLSGLVVPGILLVALVLSIALRPGDIVRNQALIPAHQAIYTARLTGQLPERMAGQAIASLPEAIRQDPINPELYGVYATLLAWQEEPTAALEAFGARVEMDGREPYRYAPFLTWQSKLTGNVPEGDWQTLLRIYRQWQARFPERADLHALVGLVLDQHLAASEQAAATQRQALEAGATPRSLLDYYDSVLAEKLAAVPKE